MDNRFRAIIDFLINPNGLQPLGVVTDYFARVEFQNHGSPHLHMFLWIKDAPNVVELSGTTDGRKMLLNFIDKYISCEIPDIEVEPVLHALVVSLQLHGCSFTCKSRRARCRFGYPLPICCETIVRDTMAERKRKLYLLKRSEKEQRINAYNPMILRFWRANMDLQVLSFVVGLVFFILEIYGFCVLVGSWRIRLGTICHSLHHDGRTDTN